MRYVLRYAMQTGRGQRETFSAEEAWTEYQRLQLAGAGEISIVGPGGPPGIDDLLAARTAQSAAVEQEERRIRRKLRWRFYRMVRK